MTEHVLPCPNLPRGQLCSPCEELAAINQEISNAKSLLVALNANRISICGRMNHAHDLLTSKFPTEIVSKIFTDLRPDTISWGCGPYDIHPEISRATPLLLGAVCTAWRAIAWSTPHLWTSIFVKFNDIKSTHIDILDEWLRRSGGLPLYITIVGIVGPTDIVLGTLPSTDGIVEKVMDSFVQHSHRWLYLDLQIPQSFLHFLLSNLTHRPLLLNTFMIQSASLIERIDLGMIPNLRNFYVQNLQVDMLLNMDWKKLRKVEVVTSTINMCHALLSRASFLTHFTCDLRSKRYDVHTIIQHNHLIFLRITHWTRGTAIFLSLMEFRALQHLVVDFAPSPSNSQDIISLLQRSHCSLKTLEVDLVNQEIDFELHIIPFLAEIPSLETLALTRSGIEYRGDSSGDSVNSVLIRLSITALSQEPSTRRSMFLPNLKELRITDLALSYDRVLEVVKAHSDDPTVFTAPLSIEGYERHQYVRPLRSLDIRVWGHEYERIELDIVQQFQRAIKDGFKVTIMADCCDHGFTDILDTSICTSET